MLAHLKINLCRHKFRWNYKWNIRSWHL